MNEGFMKALDASGMSMYALSRCSGVPYTTIHEIHSGKNDINRCPAETVFKLAIALDTEPKEIMNSLRLMDGVTGKYRGIRYRWKDDGTTKIEFSWEGEQVSIDLLKQYRVARWRKYYDTFAEWEIDDFIEEKEWERQTSIS